MAALHLDHNVARQLAQLLRVAGHDVIETRQIGMPRASDDELLLIAANTGRVFVTHFVTHNEGDFVLLHKAWRRWTAAWGVSFEHAGILVLPQPPQLTNILAAQAIEGIFAARLPLTSELYLFHRIAGWQQRLEIES